MTKYKCSCGVEMYDCDIVKYITTEENDYSDFHILDEPKIIITHNIYRCPKCFETMKVKL